MDTFAVKGSTSIGACVKARGGDENMIGGGGIWNKDMGRAAGCGGMSTPALRHDNPALMEQLSAANIDRAGICSG